jgi:vacuolar-type H+-ATPase subunit H
MANHSSIFQQVEQIEQQADEVLSQAHNEAAAIRREARDRIAEMVRTTDAEIEKAKSELRNEYETRTEGALAQIGVQFLQHEDELDTLRQDRFDELVAWTARRLRDRLAPAPENHDD